VQQAIRVTKPTSWSAGGEGGRQRRPVGGRPSAARADDHQRPCAVESEAQTLTIAHSCARPARLFKAAPSSAHVPYSFQGLV